MWWQREASVGANIREVEDGNGADVGGGDDGDGDGGHQVDIVVLRQQAGHLGAALVYVDHLQIHHQLWFREWLTIFSGKAFKPSYTMGTKD